MDLEPSADQRALQDAVRQLVGRESTPERVRAAEASGFDARLWSHLTQMGAVELLIAEQLGGAGSGVLELVLVAQEAGRRVACVPLVESAVAARALADGLDRAGGPIAEMLTGVLEGRAIAVFAPRPAVDGVAILLNGGAAADAVLCLDGDEFVLAESARPPTVTGTLGFTAAASRDLAGVAVDRHVIARGREAHEAWATALARWQLGTAGVLVGIAAAAVEIAAEYARERRQFGVAIGSFQVIQQALADSCIAVEGSELLVRESAWRADYDVDGWRGMASMAFLHAGETAVQACERALHVHGGYGYTLEYDIQLFLRRAKALSLSQGDPEPLWEQIGSAAVAARS